VQRWIFLNPGKRLDALSAVPNFQFARNAPQAMENFAQPA
jgi:hypothetical protein